MSKMIAIRIDDAVLANVDRERRRSQLSRAATIKEALALWLQKRRHDEAVKRDQEGYRRKPVKKGEFSSVLGVQTWPK